MTTYLKGNQQKNQIIIYSRLTTQLVNPLIYAEMPLVRGVIVANRRQGVTRNP